MKFIKPSLLCAIAALTLTSTTTFAAPTPVYFSPTSALGVNNINIIGTLYNATFHNFEFGTATSYNFNQIWDPNGDGDFSDSTTGSAPTFWGNPIGATIAADKIANTLQTHGLDIAFNVSSDAFFIPFKYADDNPAEITAYGDVNFSTATDLVTSTDIHTTGFFLPDSALYDASYVTFERVVIPEPTSFALLTLTSLPLLSRRTRRKR
ncbi:hypothetical protein JD969_10495 [Planctomycetota bacterium]|nr:hypothetical protein JD969_10495 [Planctomycetota bacterium]